MGLESANEVAEREKSICSKFEKDYLPFKDFKALVSEFRLSIQERILVLDDSLMNQISSRGFIQTEHDNPNVHIDTFKKQGRGVVASKPIDKDAKISRFEGIKLQSPRTCLFPNDPPERIDDHLFQISEDLHLYPKYRLTYFFNHSCDPNCGIMNNVDLHALRDIKEGEQLTWDYDTSDDSDWFMKCKCGSANCRGLIRGFRFLPEYDRQRYRGYIADWLVKKYQLSGH